jgi:hypothetical protein
MATVTEATEDTDTEGDPGGGVQTGVASVSNASHRSA